MWLKGGVRQLLLSGDHTRENFAINDPPRPLGILFCKPTWREAINRALLLHTMYMYYEHSQLLVKVLLQQKVPQFL